MTTTQRGTQLQGVVFAAQACSCSCDPCACGDRCTCQGADAYLGPRWRFVGDYIQSGNIEGVNVSGRILLHLAQTAHERSEDWREVILIDQDATPEQADVLQQFFQERQGSEVSHPRRHPSSRRPVYLVPMRYTVIEGRATLAVTFAQNRSSLLQGVPSSFFKEWTYDDHVALQQQMLE